MIENDIKIRLLEKEDIPHVIQLPPKEWNSDLDILISKHFNEDYFYFIIAETNNEIAGIAHNIVFGKTSWLGHIIVKPELKRKGIGKKLTEKLISNNTDIGCTTQILIATEEGEKLYNKLGFKTESRYKFFKPTRNYNVNPDISCINKNNKNNITDFFGLDHKATNEDRNSFTEKYLKNGKVYVNQRNNRAEGFFLPEFSEGSVIAKTKEAGLELMKLKLLDKPDKIVVPEDNKTVIKFLKETGFEEYENAPRMILGEDLIWKPEYIYCRAAGYCG